MPVTGVGIPELSQECPIDEEAFEVNWLLIKPMYSYLLLTGPARLPLGMAGQILTLAVLDLQTSASASRAVSLWIAWTQARSSALQPSWCKNFWSEQLAKTWGPVTCFHKRKRLMMELRFPWWNCKSIKDRQSLVSLTTRGFKQEIISSLSIPYLFQPNTQLKTILSCSLLCIFSVKLPYICWFLFAFLVFFCSISCAKLFYQCFSHSWAIVVCYVLLLAAENPVV